MRTISSVLCLALPLLVACPPNRAPTPGTPGSCDNPAATMAVEARDSGMGVEVCVWVDNETSGPLFVATWNEWDVDLCGGQPVNVVVPDALEAGIEIPAGESREILGWSQCVRADATTTPGQDWEPALVTAISANTSDESCWNEARSPKLTGWYCEG